MNNIKSVAVFIGGKWELIKSDCDSRKYGDAEITLDDNKLYIVENETQIEKIRIDFEQAFSVNTKVLGDSWERCYGDKEWVSIEKSSVMPWYFLAADKEKVYGFGIKVSPNAMCCWTCGYDTVSFIADIRCGKQGVKLNGRKLFVAEFVIAEYEKSVFHSARDFCHEMCENPRKLKYPVYGGNDWYCCYGRNSYDKIITHTKHIAECAPKTENRPYMVIDDGWEICHQQGSNENESFNGGPWKYSNRNFENMKKLADEIKALGVIPGIWMRPLLTVEKLPDEYVLKRESMKCSLDPSVPGVLEQIKSDIREIVSWGYRLIKHDFSSFDIFGKWGYEEGYCDVDFIFYDESKTTAEIIKDLYSAIREAAGDETIIIGCNTISHLSAGVFELQRTGDDTSGIEWERTRKMGINTLAFRMAQHGTFYASDADCVGITKNVPWDKNRQWLDLLSKSGTPLFVSISEDAYTEEVKSSIKSAFKKAAEVHKPSQPLDWIDNMIPCRWESDFGVDEYNF